MGGWTWDNYDVYVMAHDGSNQRRVTRHNYYRAGNPWFLGDGKSIVFFADGDYPDVRTYLFTVLVDGTQPPTRLTIPPNLGGDYAAWGSEPSVSLDGKRIAFISDRAESFHYDVLTMGVDGTDPRPLRVTKISRYNQAPVFLPDGKGIMFLAGTEWNAYSRPIYSLWQVDMDGKNGRRVADSGLFTDPQHWRPKP
jgi:Tol biopolymer transport system component